MQVKEPANTPLNVTLKQVADAAGVSLATASYALNDGGSVGQQTRKRVKDIAHRLGYKPNLSAKAMRTGRTGALGLVLPDLTNPFFPQLAQSVIGAARDAGYDTFMASTLGSKSNEQHSIEALYRRGIDGLIWFPVDDASSMVGPAHSLPTVVIDRTLEGFDCLLADCEAGGRAAAGLLLSAGHRRIGIVSGPCAALSSRQRAVGARTAIVGHGELAWEVEAAFSPDLDHDVVLHLARHDVTAVVAGSDLIALGVIRELQRMGRCVPQEVSVIGFDNMPWCELSTPTLSTVDIPISEMGLEAIQMLLRRMGAPNDSRRQVIFAVTPVERGSIAAPASDH